MDDLYYLRYVKILIFVLQGNTLTETSRKLNMSQPAITKIIQKTEKTLGIKLLDRKSRSAFSVDITAEGKLMLGYLENTLTYHREFISEVEKIKNGDKVSILLPPLETNLYSDILNKQFKKQFPQKTITINTTSSINIEEVLLENDHDFAIIPSPISNNKFLSYSSLKTQDFLAILYNFDKKVKEVDFDEIKNLPVVLQTEGFKIRKLILDLYNKANTPINISNINFFFGAKYGLINTKFTETKVSYATEDFIKAYEQKWDVKSSIAKIKNCRTIGACQELFIAHKKNKKLSSDENKILEIIRKNIK